MAQMALTVVGGVVGGAFGMPALGAWLGGTLGAYIERSQQDKKRIEGPRLEDLRVQLSSYGTPIYKAWGTIRLAGNVIWSAPIEEVVTENEKSHGKGGPTTVEVHYEYFQSCAIAICEGPIDRILRIWADTKLIYSLVDDNASVNQIPDLDITLYKGTETQGPNAFIESFEGVGNVPGFRGMVYVVIDSFPLAKFGNRLPNFTFEIASNADDATVTYSELTDVIGDGVNTDNIVVTQDQLYIYIQSGDYFYRIRTTDNVILRELNTTAYPDESDFDLDEVSNVYTTQEEDSDSSKFVVVPLNLIGTWTIASWSTTGKISRVRVFRNDVYPFLVGITDDGEYIYITRRSDLTLEGTDYIVLPSPVGFHYSAIALDEEGGAVWTVLREKDGLTDDTQVRKLIPTIRGGVTAVIFNKSSDIARGDEIMFDKDTNQVIVGSSYDDKIVFYDADDMTKLGEIGLTGIADDVKSAWRHGSVNSLLYQRVGDEIKSINMSSRDIEGTWDISDMTCGSGGGGSCFDPTTFSVIVSCEESGSSYTKVHLDRGTPSPVLLSDIVSDICADVGLEGSDEVDVTDLESIEVRGFVVNDQMRARAAIQTLMDAFFFDGVETGGVMKFVLRRGLSVATITDDDLGARAEGEANVDALVTLHQQDLEIPTDVYVSYIDRNNTYMSSTQHERRLVATGVEKASYRLPIVLTADEARQIAVKHLGLAWIQRDRHQLHLSNEYLWFDPADVITVVEDGNTHVLRIEGMNYRQGVIDLECVTERAGVYTSDQEGEDIDVDPGEDIAYPGPTRALFLDVPALTSVNNTPGMYVATAGFTEDWIGAIILKNTDIENFFSLWTPFLNATNDHVIGIVTDVLGDVDDPWVWDEGNTVNIELLDMADSLSSATKAQVLMGNNIAILGDEIIQYRNATLEADGTYTLSGLVRGRYGTDDQTGSHALNEFFLVLDLSTLPFKALPLDERGVAVWYRTESQGMPGTVYTTHEIVAEMKNMKPYSPVHIRGTRNDSGDIEITWIRRTRFGGEWADGDDVPLSETVEYYLIDLLDGPGGNVVRTIQGLTEQTRTYLASEQNTDYGSLQDPLYVKIYQYSSVVGRGFGREAAI